MTDYSPMNAAPVAEPQPKSPPARIIGALFSPFETFGEIGRKPDWLVPLIVIFVVSMFSVAVMAPRMDYDALRQKMEQQQKANNLSPEQQERASRLGISITKTFMWIAPFFALGILVIVGGIYFLGVRLAGGEASFLSVLAITLYADMPVLIRTLLNAIIAFPKKLIDPEKAQMLLRSSPAFLIDMKAKPVLWAAATRADIFFIWSAILLFIGFAQLPRMNRAKSATVVITIQVIFLLLLMGVTSISVLMRKGA